ncbi:hydrolase, alpha/beta domain protein [Aneurinibacillus aneurinilyticus ATCC 12856]|jgi:esterase/lipase|uniref:Hydrolase, alpha/beta domain protein n=4 Tax=Aneurinibacillus aneurinilyticus TaxID=1391 RepID=U1YG57_ANEAE|nr:alpha/beta fold hydrolase [Aneurinibacillus aneurinilyticus]ERI11067.1 hydrolase, alpha/beta domain protein [Aneurinibacillus aneurinilyticus ATCC 12856]
MLAVFLYLEEGKMRMIGCLLIHGFTGSPYEVEPVARHFAGQGWRIETPVLAGHEGHDLSLNKVTWQDWVRSAEEVLQDMLLTCERIYIVGFSMGGLIAAHLAARYPVDKLVLLSASLFYINPRQLFKDAATIIKKHFTSTTDAKEAYRRYLNKATSTPPRAVIHFRHLVKILKQELPKVTTPTLIIQGGKDDLVEPRSADYIYRTIRSTEKHLHILPESKHIICHDCEQAQLLQLIDEFLTSPQRAGKGEMSDES